MEPAFYQESKRTGNLIGIRYLLVWKGVGEIVKRDLSGSLRISVKSEGELTVLSQKNRT